MVPLTRDGREVGAVALRRHGDTLTLAYTVTVGRGVGRTVEDRIPLLSTRQPGGGSRLWLSCPGCGRRCAVLFGNPRFRCRTCTGAPYASQNETRRDRLLRKARAVRAKVGGPDILLLGFPAKPPRMRWRTYLRLRAQDQALQREAFELTMRQVFAIWRELEGAEPGRADMWR